jgi:hypothetical protein
MHSNGINIAEPSTAFRQRLPLSIATSLFMDEPISNGPWPARRVCRCADNSKNHSAPHGVRRRIAIGVVGHGLS